MKKTQVKQRETRGRKRNIPQNGFGEWFNQAKLTNKIFAEIIGISEGYMYQLVRGDLHPSIKQAYKMIVYSETLKDIRPLTIHDFFVPRDTK